jgi:transcriptional regulator with PAS, ATPase and Fis domain
MRNENDTIAKCSSEEQEGSGIYSRGSGERVGGDGAAENARRALSMCNVVGSSKLLVELYDTVDRIADTPCTVLITGESGTGKELVAQAIHSASDATGPIVAVNCGAIPETLLESELFGHARGAFTGAHANKQGRITQASGGTLFLDEVGELPLSLQVKLLRVLQNREYSPVGDTRTLTTDARIVAATNVPLEDSVREGRFREDLYYRLNVINLSVPALRDRKEDVPALAEHFLREHRERLGRQRVTAISDAALRLLCAYSWPGNVRELSNGIERALLVTRGTSIEPADLPARVCGLANAQKFPQVNLPDSGLDLRRAVESYENQLIRQALDRCKWNKKQAAGMLGLNRTTLVEMLKRKRITQVA